MDHQESGAHAMALSIKDLETEKLARTGETVTVATRRAIEDRLGRMAPHARKAALLLTEEPLLFKGNDFSKIDSPIA